MNHQVITIRPDGSIVGLDHKKKGLDLRQFGKASIRRISVVEWDEDLQGWFVQFSEGPYAGRRLHSGDLINLDRNLLLSYVGRYVLVEREAYGAMPLIFSDYEDGVAMEVAVVQALQLAGRGQEIFR